MCALAHVVEESAVKLGHLELLDGSKEIICVDVELSSWDNILKQRLSDDGKVFKTIRCRGTDELIFAEVVNDVVFFVGVAFYDAMRALLRETFRREDTR